MANTYYWLPYALVRLVLFYIVGILLAIYDVIDLNREVGLLITTILAFSFIVCRSLITKDGFVKLNILLSILGFSTLVCLGYTNLKWNNQSYNEDHILNNNAYSAYRAFITDNGFNTEKTIRYRVEVESVFNSSWESASGVLYLYINKADSSKYKYGDEILVAGMPNVLQGPANPGEFDYKRFLSFNNIYHQHYSNGKNITRINEGRGNKLLGFTYGIRKSAVDILSKNISSERERNIALALVLGNKDGLTDEIKNAYSASGAMHVLAVSGLHVGIIYLIVLLLFGKLNKTLYGRWGLAILSLLLLWSYAAVTGFSPSVLRAVTMFSFVAVAKASLKTTNIYNTLAASAFVLLVWNPFLIMSVGFQLSYLAVIGIVFIQPQVYNLFISRNYLLDKIWQITSVSVAAQIATFALGLLYFHQFPSFFLLSNLVVIPGAFLILFGGIITLATGFYDPIASVIGEFLRWLIYGINEVVFWIENLPYSLIQGVYITTPETWYIMLAILGILLMIKFKSFKYIYVTFVCSILFSVSQWITLISNTNQNQITVYSINNHLAIDFNTQGISTVYSDSILLNDQDKFRFHIRPNLLRNSLTEYSPVQRKSSINGIETINWKGKRIIILTNNVKLNADMNPMECDVLILSDQFNGKVDDLKRSFNFDQLIIDASLRKKVADNLLIEAEAYHLNVHSVHQNGALQLKI